MAGTGQAPARQAAILQVYPTPLLVQQYASGMKSVMLAAQAIQCGDAEIVVAGGMENMSLIPHYMNLRNGTKFGPATMIDGMQRTD
jgi:acetyl-CoA C-acetyltransferase